MDTNNTATENLAHTLTWHRVGTNEDGDALYAFDDYATDYVPSGHCYLDSDGYLVVPAGEQADVRRAVPQCPVTNDDTDARAREIAAGLTVSKTGPGEYTISDADRCVIAVVRLAHGADIRAVARVLAEGNM